MRFQARDIAEDGLDLDLPLDADWLRRNVPEAQPTEDGLRLRGRLERSGDDFLLRGRLRGALSQPCGRCLEPARVPVDSELTVSFVQKDPGLPTTETIDPDDAGGDTVVFDGDEIDVGEQVREELLIALPMTPLCKDDCLGICPVCGGNRNRKACDCEEKARQKLSPFAALAKLKS